MRVHYLQHVAFEGLGSIEPSLRDAGHRITRTRMDLNEALPNRDDFDLLIVMGGPMGANDDDQLSWLGPEKSLIRQAIDNNKRVLGICLGAQLIAAVLGARVFKNAHREIGWFPIYDVPDTATHHLGGIVPDGTKVFHWHGDTFDLPSGAMRLASSEACQNQAFAFGDHVLALQFHLEVTFEGAKLLVHECQAELVPAPYVQLGQEMLADPARFDLINPLMASVLQAIMEH